MLVLARRVEEAVVVRAGSLRLRIQVLSVAGRIVRLGIDGPADAVILREELDQAREANRRAAAAEWAALPTGRPEVQPWPPSA